MKTCKKCGVEKLLAEFGKHSISKDGLRYVCKPCNSTASSLFVENNPEKTKANRAAYYETNKVKIRSDQAAYRKANKKKFKARGAAYYIANIEKCKARNVARYAANPSVAKAITASWVKKNPDACRVIRQNRRARKLESGGKLSKGLAARLFKLQRGKCACGCKQPLGNDYHLDHNMPLALGGSNTDDNMQLLRQRCNNQKHAKHPIDFMQSRGFLL